MGLLKTAAKVAVASSVHGRVQRRQHDRWAHQDAAAAPAPAAAPVAPAPVAPSAGTDDMLTQLAKLGELRDAGILSEVEFAVQKDRILRS